MTAVFIFIGFVGFMFWMSSVLGRKSGSADGFFVAGGQIHWFVNGIALTGGYLSAGSFLGICGMIAFEGFDGYLYSIGFLPGWVVALFVVAEPLRRFGKYTFADAIEARDERQLLFPGIYNCRSSGGGRYNFLPLFCVAFYGAEFNFCMFRALQRRSVQAFFPPSSIRRSMSMTSESGTSYQFS